MPFFITCPIPPWTPVEEAYASNTHFRVQIAGMTCLVVVKVFSGLNDHLLNWGRRVFDTILSRYFAALIANSEQIAKR